MLPTAFVWLPALPLTSSGKIDRRALPEPELIAASEVLAAPRDALEEILLGLWGSVLNHPTPGLHDSFFELGGHSLLATQLVSRLRDALGITVPVRWLFETPTVAGLAERIRSIQTGAQDDDTTARTIPLSSRERPLPLSFAQQRLWFLEQLEGPGTTYNMAWALSLSGDLNHGRAELRTLGNRPPP